MSPTLLAIACLLVVTFGYIGLCAGSPFGNCRKCRGLGFQLKHNRHGKPKRGKPCHRCKATGRRIRIGRHLLNLWLRTYRDGTH